MTLVPSKAYGPLMDWNDQLRPGLAGLILHIHREVIHHGAEILLLRDLYRHQPTGDPQ